MRDPVSAVSMLKNINIPDSRFRELLLSLYPKIKKITTHLFSK